MIVSIAADGSKVFVVEKHVLDNEDGADACMAHLREQFSHCFIAIQEHIIENKQGIGRHIAWHSVDLSLIHI